MLTLPFRDRDAAARHLATALDKFRAARPIILAIPRGAVPMGRRLAVDLGAELDIVLVRKIGAPDNPEFAIGAIDEHGELLLTDYAEVAAADPDYVRQESERQLALIRARRAQYRPGRPPLALKGRTVIVVDDGLATGSTMIAALKAARAQHPHWLVCAVPVAAAESLAQVAAYADEVVCLATPTPFHAVGRFYEDFLEVGDAEVIRTLAAPPPPEAQAGKPSVQRVHIGAGSVQLDGDLCVPTSPCGLVIFAHGSGSSRHSSRNRYVAGVLNRGGLASLLFDLLTEQEDGDTAPRFDIGLLTRRLDAALRWAQREPNLRGLPIGLFGASTGAAAAVALAAARSADIVAVVSRGGRPDLAGTTALTQLRTPTLLIVGSADLEVLELNHAARSLMHAHADIAVVPGATHLFDEPGTLEQAAVAAAAWFQRWFQAA